MLLKFHFFYSKKGLKNFTPHHFVFETVLFLIIFFVIGFSFFFNIWLDSKLEKTSNLDRFSVSENFQKKDKINVWNAVPVRKYWKDSSGEFYLHEVHLNDEVIAEFKSLHGKIYDFSGDIPDGRVDFVSLDGKRFGYEHYRDNQKHGQSAQYFEKNKIYKRQKYFLGSLMEEKEYFKTGILKMQKDLTDALFLEGQNQVVSPGQGAVYYPNGALKFSWSFTKSGPMRYEKNYDREGKLLAQTLYRSNGEVFKTRRYD